MQATEDGRISTGIPGLDEVLGGGFTPCRMYLVEGDSGAGKTTLAMQFLLEGASRDERVLYVTFAETRGEVEAVARSHGWVLDGVHIHESIPGFERREEEEQTLFHPAELELGETTEEVLDLVRKLKPARVVLDSMSELRLLSQDSLQYRRQALALKQFFADHDCTALVLDDLANNGAGDPHLHSVAHGVLHLEQVTPDYGDARRRLKIVKFRGVSYRGGWHDYRIVRGGIELYPRLVVEAVPDSGRDEIVSSGLDALDALLGGGMDRGTSTLVVGPSGSGKSSIVLQYATAAAARGERTAFFVFDSTRGATLRHARRIGMHLEDAVSARLVTIEQLEPAELTVGEFNHRIRAAVEGKDGGPPAQFVVIDSLNGYLHAMSEERQVIPRLRETLTFLAGEGVNTFVVLVQHGLVGDVRATVEVSYVSDTVLLLRHFEAAGAVRKAVSVVKRRGGFHEATIREFAVTSEGIRIGAVLRGFDGVLTSVPRYTGQGEALRRDGDA